ncbi:glycosyltransferase family 4 protein [Agriterribacter sp.]|uniref:glycosyltransferase family 4 protein n=1 Tax=Agriterribacter sp. TaxID=2821509 RepID=UPI002BEC35F1|nr:glycosyltransferase family 4 protein [Agriterribacter sp.]HTN08999.1 glycosyltransferase family 4 protein [Agriterribacter sp.]
MDRQKIVHIANDYSGSTVYKNLIRELNYLKIEQIVYTPVKTALSIGKNEIELQTAGSEIIYSNILNNSVDRIFYRLKVKKILNDIESKVDFSRVKLIHAHTWYSDGGVAYLLSKKYNIPYVVTVRNSDLNVFQKYLIHERTFGKKILEHAKSVVLIAASYKPRLLSLPSLQSIKKELETKIEIIPNGVDPYWIEHTRAREIPEKPKDTFNILFIGKFSKGKNITALQKAAILIQKDARFNVKLHIVGGDGSEVEKVLQQIEAFPDLFKYYGKVYDKEQLLGIFGSCDIFAMPSRHESFGLVYVESMLQGLPVLYTHNEGIDGFYEEKIGEKVLGFSAEEIKQKLEILITNFNNYIIPTEKMKQNHDWALIAKMYQAIYNNQ